MTDLLHAVADTTLGLALGYLFAVFRRPPQRRGNLRYTENEAEGNANVQAGRNIKTVLPLDVDAQLSRMQQDKEWLRRSIAQRDEYILRMHQLQAARPAGFPLIDLNDLNNLNKRKETA